MFRLNLNKGIFPAGSAVTKGGATHSLAAGPGKVRVVYREAQVVTAGFTEKDEGNKVTSAGKVSPTGAQSGIPKSSRTN